MFSSEFEQEIKNKLWDLIKSNTKDIHLIMITEMEKIIMIECYKATNYNQSLTSKKLGLSRGTVILKLKQYFPE